MHRGRLLVIAQFLKRELTGTSGINPFWACDTGRDEQPELLVVLGGESHPLIEKRPVDLSVARLDFVPMRPE